MKTFLLTFDTIIQAIMLACCIFFPLTFFVAPFLGAWQLGSSLLKGILLWSKMHFLYFLSAGAYLQFLYLFSKNEESLNFLELEWVGNIWWFVFLPPLVAAVWYFKQSMKDAKEHKPQEELV